PCQRPFGGPMNRTLAPALLTVCLLPAFAFSQSPRVADPTIAGEVMKIMAIDNHTHVPKLTASGEKDTEYDALPCGGYVEPMPDQLLARPEENALYRAAWKALWG